MSFVPRRRYTRHRAAMSMAAARMDRRKRFFRKKWRPARSIPTIMPKNFICKLPLTYRFVLNPTVADTPVTQIVRANSCRDPLSSDSNVQPLGFAEMMKFYNHGICFKSSIRVELQSNNAAGSTGSYHVVLALRDDATPITFIQQLLNAKRYQQTAMLPSNYNGTKVLKASVDMKQFFGLKSLEDDQFEFTSATDSTEQAHWHISAISNEGITPTGSIYGQFQIWYYCKFFEPVDLSASAHA